MVTTIENFTLKSIILNELLWILRGDVQQCQIGSSKKEAVSPILSVGDCAYETVV